MKISRTEAVDHERVDPEDVTSAMRLALGEARLAAAHGDVPVGAVVLSPEGVIAAAHNERERRRDPTAHAEVLALAAAAAIVGLERLSSCTLVVTLEPCPMCAGAVLTFGIGALVFGAADERAGACGSRYNLCADPRLGREVPVTSGVLADEAGQAMTEFFEARRPSR